MRPTPVSPLDVRGSLAGKHLLVTGVTGFLGKVWVLHLLDALPEIGRITLLVRGRRGESAVDRTNRVLTTSPALRPLRAEHGQNLASFLQDRLAVLPGDITEPLAGVHPDALDRLPPVDLVVNFAGTVDFQPDPLLALGVNTHGAVHMADLAARLGAPLVHVSTAYVAGRIDGRVPESLDPAVAPNGTPFDARAEVDAVTEALSHLSTRRSDRQARIDLAQARADALGFPNLYTWSKSLAERLLLTRDDVHVTLVRPSIVECARAFPFAGWNEGLNTSAPLAWLISTAFRDFPSRAHHHFDIAPVDLVARGMSLAAASAFTAPHGRILHLGTSGSNPVHFGRIIELTGLANRKRLRDDPQASAFQRLVVAQLDPVPVDADRKPLWHVSRLRKGAKTVQKWLRDLDRADKPSLVEDLAGDALTQLTRKGVRQTNDTLRTLGRIEYMLDLFQPFVHDHDYIFENDGIRALSAGLPDDQRAAFAWDDHTIDWRHYWHDVQYPGLWQWCIPILEGQRAPEDPMLEPPVALGEASAARDVLERGAK